MADGGGDGAAFEAETVGPGVANAAIGAVAGDEGAGEAVVVGVFPGEVVGEERAFADTDDAGLRCHGEVFGGEGAATDGAAEGCDVGLGRTCVEGDVADDLAAADDALDGAGVEVGEEGDVGQEAGGQEAAVAPAEVAGGAEAGRAVDGEGVTTGGDGLADGGVEVALVADVEGVAVIGAEAEAVAEGEGEEGREVGEVAGDGPGADEDSHAAAELGEGLGDGAGLVVVGEAGGADGVERVALGEGRVAVDGAAGEGGELGQRVGGLAEEAGEVHELGQGGVFGVGRDGRGVEHGPGGLRGKRGHARRNLHLQAEEHPGGGAAEEVDGRRAAYVREFVRVADRGGDAVGQDESLPGVGRDEGGLDVAVGIHETRDGGETRRVEGFDAFVAFAHGGDTLPADGQVGPLQFPGGEVEEPRAFDNQISRPPPHGDIDAIREFGCVPPHGGPLENGERSVQARRVKPSTATENGCAPLGRRLRRWGGHGELLSL